MDYLTLITPHIFTWKAASQRIQPKHNFLNNSYINREQKIPIWKVKNMVNRKQMVEASKKNTVQIKFWIVSVLRKSFSIDSSTMSIAVIDNANTISKSNKGLWYRWERNKGIVQDKAGKEKEGYWSLMPGFMHECKINWYANSRWLVILVFNLSSAYVIVRHLRGGLPECLHRCISSASFSSHLSFVIYESICLQEWSECLLV